MSKPRNQKKEEAMKKIILILLLFLTAGIKNFSQPGNMHRGFIKEDGRLEKLLKLTDDQTKKFNDLKYNAEQKSIDLRSQIQKNRLELRKLFSEKNLDSKKILELTNKNSEIQAKLKEIHVKTMLDLNSLLTDEQKEIFTQHRVQMKDNFDFGCCDKPMKRMGHPKRF